MTVSADIIYRLGAFFGVFLIMALWEMLAPKRALHITKTKRWLNNLSILVINIALVRAIFPTAVVGVALVAQQKGWGLFTNYPLPFWLTVTINVILLDLVIYFQHRLFHKVHLFWRFHRMHHMDLDIDVTTGIRFHPIEIIISLLIKFAAVILLGAPALAVVIFQVVLNATSMFNHGNVRMPRIIDVILRALIVTPDMHRVHHSVIRQETDSNFGFNLSVWTIFKTYRAQPQQGHQQMQIGLTEYRDETQCTNLARIIKNPFTD